MDITRLNPSLSSRLLSLDIPLPLLLHIPLHHPLHTLQLPFDPFHTR